MLFVLEPNTLRLYNESWSGNNVYSAVAFATLLLSTLEERGRHYLSHPRPDVSAFGPRRVQRILPRPTAQPRVAQAGALSLGVQ